MKVNFVSIFCNINSKIEPSESSWWDELFYDRTTRCKIDEEVKNKNCWKTVHFRSMTKLADIDLSKFNTQLFDWTVEQIYTIIEFLQRMENRSKKIRNFFLRTKSCFEESFMTEKGWKIMVKSAWLMGIAIGISRGVWNINFNGWLLPFRCTRSDLGSVSHRSSLFHAIPAPDRTLR